MNIETHLLRRLAAALMLAPLTIGAVIAAGPALTFNEHLQAGWAHELDLEDVDAVFDAVFAKLPPEVTIFPSENYYYWKLNVAGREVWGNIRLPAGARDRGVLSFGYAEFTEFPSLMPIARRDRIARSKYYTKADGVVVAKRDRFTYEVGVADKTVVFRLNQLDQSPPKKFELRPGEKFIERTFDESGMQFILLFNTGKNYFNWILNEEEGVPVPDHFKKLAEGVLLGRRTGFVFWRDGDRKVLASIRKYSIRRNDYYDGPFDQLADNYAEEAEIKKYMELALPGVKGRIDKFGYYTDRERPVRVALSNYGSYYTYAEAVSFVNNAKKSGDPYHFISRSGRAEKKVETKAEKEPASDGEEPPSEP